jgi:hypothetical protein
LKWYDMTLDGSAMEDWDEEAVLRGITCPTLLLQANRELGGLMTDADVAWASGSCRITRTFICGRWGTRCSCNSRSRYCGR